MLAGSFVARHAAAQCFPPGLYSRSRACDFYSADCGDSGSLSGNPAVSSVSHGWMNTEVNLGATADFTLRLGSFDANAHAGGSAEIHDSTGTGANGSASGFWYDCLTLTGGSGPAYLHIPVHLTGARTLSWSATPEYVPTPGVDLAGANAGMSCSAGTVGSPVPTACSDPNFPFTDSGPIDQTFEIVFTFTFGQQVSLQLGPYASAGVGAAGNGSSGSMQGMAEIDLHGQFLPAYVVDFTGHTVGGASLVAASGFDYLTAPEPGAAFAVLAALTALAALRASR
jgi:hypothetical protein